MNDRDYIHASGDILRLHKLCFDNGKTINGRLWNEGNELIRIRYNMDMDLWMKIRTEYVNPILKQLGKL
jgi:hypothetical protein